MKLLLVEDDINLAEILAEVLSDYGYAIDITDKVISLDTGADERVVKPVDLLELMARIRTLMRRGAFCAKSNLAWNNLVLEPSSREVTYDGQSLELTPKEFSLLELFLRSGKRVLSRQAIINYIWADEEAPSEEAVKAHIKYLRQKLKIAGAPHDVIETVRGVGYRLKSKN